MPGGVGGWPQLIISSVISELIIELFQPTIDKKCFGALVPYLVPVAMMGRIGWIRRVYPGLQSLNEASRKIWRYGGQLCLQGFPYLTREQVLIEYKNFIVVVNDIFCSQFD
jgi:hypothetical protein